MPSSSKRSRRRSRANRPFSCSKRRSLPTGRLRRRSASSPRLTLSTPRKNWAAGAAGGYTRRQALAELVARRRQVVETIGIQANRRRQVVCQENRPPCRPSGKGTRRGRRRQKLAALLGVGHSIAIQANGAARGSKECILVMIGRRTVQRTGRIHHDAPIVVAAVVVLIGFSAEVPVRMADLLQNVADYLKQLPASRVLKIAGYTNNTGNPADNVALS